MSHLSAFGSLHSLLQRAIASASIWFIVKVMKWSQLHRFSFGLSLWNVSLCLLPQINYGFEVIQLSYIAQIKEIRHNASKCGHLPPKVHYREHINFDVGIPVRLKVVSCQNFVLDQSPIVCFACHRLGSPSVRKIM